MTRWMLGIAGLLVVLVGTLAVFGLPIGDSLRLLYEGALSDKFGIHRTLLKSAPLIMVALGMLIAWRAGMFNIGGEGQLLCGASAGAAVAFAAPHAPAIVIVLMTALAGAAYAGIAAWLYVGRGVNIVISTILLNFVALHTVSYLVRGPLQEPTHSIPQTAQLGTNAMFTTLDLQTGLHEGLFVVPIVALAVWIWLMRSPGGFQLRLVGANADAARAARIPVARVQVFALLLSGALCGLAGGIEFAGVSGVLFDKFSPGWGFLGIPVALLGALHPLGVIVAGLYFGALLAGSKNLEAFGAASSSLVFVMQGVAVLGFVAIQEILKRRVAR